MWKPILENVWIRALCVIGLAVLIGMLAYLLSSVLVPLFFAFIFAYIFDPLIDKIEGRRYTRLGAVALLMLAILLWLICIPLYLLPNMISEAEKLVAPPETGEDWFLDNTLQRLPVRQFLSIMGHEIPEGEPFNPRDELAHWVADFVAEDLQGFVKSHAQDIAQAGTAAGKSAAGFFASVGNFIVGVVLTLGNIVLFVVVGVYLLKDYDRIIEVMHDLVPPRHRPTVNRIMGNIDQQLRAFLRGQAMVCAFLAVGYSIGLLLSGTPFALTIGIFGGIASFIPYLGIALTIGPAVLLTLLKFGLDWHVFGVLATFALVQTLESNVVTPRVVGSQVGLGPVWVILAIMVFGSTLGFLGLLLAVPIAAVIKVLVAEGLALYRASSFFEGAPPPSGASGP